MTKPFASLNRAYAQTFQPGRLSLGLVVPIEDYLPEERPAMDRHIDRVRLAEELGFAAVWLRDIPFEVPSFGDVGQMFDPFVYLGALAMQTDRIGIGIASAILPLRHPAHLAKAAASVDVLSGGRMLLGVASGDRPEEYPAMAIDYETRGMRFRESVEYMKAAFHTNPRLENGFGRLNGHVDVLPKPTAGRIPMLITGGCQQPPEWGAEHMDGFITYPRPAAMQQSIVEGYRARVAEACDVDKPVMQSLYINLMSAADAPARPIHLGFSSGVEYLLRYLKEIEALGVNHVAINLRFNYADTEDTLRQLAEVILPEFASNV
ncbi:LLM class oxidoreductase [Shimia ponticola]|uniref:LLM class oxidoreductase n=1 Tax=Shimia ponticola TaxID=2582893 RepID=UPI002105FCAD|nr:LLM class oxidoreductase [Shimia ponticola]